MALGDGSLEWYEAMGAERGGGSGECGKCRTAEESAPEPSPSDESAVRVPTYYWLPGLYLAGHVQSQVFDLCDALWPNQHNYNLKDAMKYLVRHGRKPGQEGRKDLLKAVRCLLREVRRLGGQVPGDL